MHEIVVKNTFEREKRISEAIRALHSGEKDFYLVTEGEGSSEALLALLGRLIWSAQSGIREGMSFKLNELGSLPKHRVVFSSGGLMGGFNQSGVIVRLEVEKKTNT